MGPYVPNVTSCQVNTAGRRSDLPSLPPLSGPSITAAQYPASDRGCSSDTMCLNVLQGPHATVEPLLISRQAKRWRMSSCEGVLESTLRADALELPPGWHDSGNCGAGCSQLATALQPRRATPGMYLAPFLLMIGLLS